ncbi:MAG TPA: hypothetical protein VFI03_04785 [Solirubrobacterales bacterium]|nr:hypothetical protein [Solirubrobacterales bacterium]
MTSEENPVATEKNGQGQGEQSAFSSVLLPVLTVIGTGIGAIGFVIFFGGFVVWARFDAIGLPANEAVAQVPRGDLVTTGASFLVPALLIALAAAAATVALWDFAIGSRRRHRALKAEADLMRANSELTKLRAEADRCKNRIAVLSTGGPAEAELGELRQRLAALEGTEIPTAEERRAKLTEDQPLASKSDKKERWLQYLVGGSSMLLAELVVISFGFGGLSFGDRLLLLITMFATIGVAIVVISMTDHFAWFTLCVFLGVGVTVAASTYARTHSHVKVSPVALLSGSDPVSGFFVAETGEAIYLGIPDRSPRLMPSGELDFDNDAATLVRLPKESVSGLTVGPIMDEADAYRRSIVLALILCRRTKLAAAEVLTTTTNTTPKRSVEQSRGCAPTSVRRLHRQLDATAWSAVRG